MYMILIRMVKHGEEMSGKIRGSRNIDQGFLYVSIFMVLLAQYYPIPVKI